MGIEENTVTKASEALKTLTEQSENTTITKRAAVQKLKKDIVAARAAGRTWAEIVQTLKESGLDVTEAHIRASIQKPGTKAGEKKTKEKSKLPESKPKEKIIDTIKQNYTPGAGQNKIRPDTEIL